MLSGRGSYCLEKGYEGTFWGDGHDCLGPEGPLVQLRFGHFIVRKLCLKKEKRPELCFIAYFVFFQYRKATTTTNNKWLALNAYFMLAIVSGFF